MWHSSYLLTIHALLHPHQSSWASIACKWYSSNTLMTNTVDAKLNGHF